MYRQILADERHQRAALENLVVICLQDGRADEAEAHLRSLVETNPSLPLYCDRLATLLESRGRNGEAIACYQRLLENQPELVNSRYNLARLLKRVGHPDEALRTYGECLARGIQRAEEVHTNMAVIYSDQHRHQEARRSLEQALALNPHYTPAQFNLALLHEEQGDWTTARSLYAGILKQEPRHTGALSHLAQGEKIRDPVAPIIRQMKRALRREGLAGQEREELLYALGKANDDCGRYSRAFDYFQQANLLSRQRVGPYDRRAREELVDQLVARCDCEWLRHIAPVSSQPLVFICGMFRSGSTLLEQILAAHPEVTAGGEIDYFQRHLAQLPDALTVPDPARLQETGRGYIDYLAKNFPAAARVSNKRPDNFLYLGLLRSLFPNARFLHTLRQPLDNCLSLFLQPLAADQAHANDLLDTGHYYLQYRRLMAHWLSLAGDSVLDVEYETLVRTPRETIARVLDFLRLDWHEDCLQFHRVDNRVRTASVHQVRQPLYTAAAGRWRHYAGQLESLRGYLRARGIETD